MKETILQKGVVNPNDTKQAISREKINSQALMIVLM